MIQTMIRGNRYVKKKGEDLKESYTEEVIRFLDRGKTQEYAKNAPFNALLSPSRRRLQRTYSQRLKWIHRIKRDALHRQVKAVWILTKQLSQQWTNGNS